MLAWPLFFIYMEIPKQEDRKTEFKSDWKDAKCLPELCAFANTDGGSLFVGINDNGDVVGVNPNKAEKWKESLPQLIERNLGFYPDKAEVRSEEGKTVFYIKVISSDYLIKYNGCYYGREGEHSRPLKGKALEVAKKKKILKPWDEFTLGNVSASDLKTDLLKEKIKNRCSNSSNKVSSDDESEKLLKNLGLMSQGKIKRAAVFLCHHKPYEIIYGTCIKIIYRVDGPDKTFPLSENLLFQVDKVLEGLSNRLDCYIRKNQDDSSKNKTKEKELSKSSSGVFHIKQPSEGNPHLSDKPKSDRQDRQNTQNPLSQVQEDLKRDFETALYASLALKDYSIHRAIEIKVYENKFTIGIPVGVSDLAQKPTSTKPSTQDYIKIIRDKVDESLKETPNLCRVFKKMGFDVEEFINERLFSSISQSNHNEDKKSLEKSEKIKDLDFKRNKSVGWEIQLSPGGGFTGFQIQFDFDKWKKSLKFENSDERSLGIGILKSKGGQSQRLENEGRKSVKEGRKSVKEGRKSVKPDISKERRTPGFEDGNKQPGAPDNPPRDKRRAWKKSFVGASALAVFAVVLFVVSYESTENQKGTARLMEGMNNKVEKLFANQRGTAQQMTKIDENIKSLLEEVQPGTALKIDKLFASQEEINQNMKKTERVIKELSKNPVEATKRGLAEINKKTGNLLVSQGETAKRIKDMDKISLKDQKETDRGTANLPKTNGGKPPMNPAQRELSGALIFQDLFKICLDKSSTDDYSKCMRRMEKEIGRAFCL